MKILDVTPLAIPAIQVISFARFTDPRGYFTETYRASDLGSYQGVDRALGERFVQHNESYSRTHVLRGLHFQWNPFMGKLVRTISGRMLDLVLDIRRGSPTWGKLVVHDLPATPDDPTGTWIWVPPGFAHGNLFTEPTVIEYLCTGEYSPGCEGCISPLAPDLDWSLCHPDLAALFRDVTTGPDLIVTDKDRGGLSLAAWEADPRSHEFIHGPL